MTPSDLANKIESRLKLHEGLEMDFRFVMNPDAAAAFVNMLRKTDELLDLVSTLRAERDAAARDMRERCARLIQSGAGMADLIDQQELDQQAEYILRLPLPLSVIATVREGDAT